MKKEKIKFSHFEDSNSIKINSIDIYLGNLNINECLDDVESKMEIVDGEIKFTILNQHYYDKEELKDIYNELKKINWDNGYDFFDFIDINTNISYILIADGPSETFNIINSSKNKKNINDFMNGLKSKGII
jgi:hypothetical protein